MHYYYSGSMWDISADEYIGLPRKRSNNTAEFSVHNTPFEQNIDQFLNLDRNTESGATADQKDTPDKKKVQKNHEMIKERNKINAKKSRDRKKLQFDQMLNKLKDLETYNGKLKDSRSFCGRCKSRLDSFPLESSVSRGSSLTARYYKTMEVEFEKPNFKPRTKNYQGKIWITIGIIMLIIGLNIHGIDKQPIEIGLKKSTIGTFRYQLEKDQPIKLPMSWKYGYLKQSPYKQYKFLEVQLMNLKIYTIDDVKADYRTSEDYMFEFSRNFVMKLYGYINDIGRYI